jgi:hypothetical protein
MWPAGGLVILLRQDTGEQRQEPGGEIAIHDQ